MNISEEFDTIAAVSTPLGTGGVGIIRISGGRAFEIIGKIFTNPNFSPKRFNYGKIVDHSVSTEGHENRINPPEAVQQTVIDEVIVLPFFAPDSYTGEDVVEIQCHGGINVVKNILSLVLKNGARPAERGEFTKRAFLNKKMDLSQAEAVADIIHAKTSDFAKLSAKNLSGFLKNKIDDIRGEIFKVLSEITAGIDFPEEVKEPEYDYLEKTFENIIFQIKDVLSGADASNIFRQGVSAVIVGKPNVGKSSIFNALLNSARAIVTDAAGTTRDVLRETLDLGVPVTLTDTAGIREDEKVSQAEKIGIEYSKESLNNADLVLFVHDASTGLDDEDKKILKLLEGKKHIVIANKSDLNESTYGLNVSARTGKGIKELKNLLSRQAGNIEPENTEFITNTRQQACLTKAQKALEQALLAAKVRELQDLISIDVKSALLALDELTGELVTDEILNNIFDNFCIGK